jgi:hypothetical protein
MGLYMLHANYDLQPGCWINWHCVLDAGIMIASFCNWTFYGA